MTWIDECDHRVLRAFAKHTSICVMIAKIDGSILYANPAMCEWSRYTLSELILLGWKRLSVDDENLQADIAEAQRLDEYNLTYTIEKQYTPKNDKPQWGLLSVMRFPPTGEMEYCCCTWEPLKNGTAEAFAKAIKNGLLVEKRINEMTTVLKQFTSQSEEDRYVLSTINMVRKHPKAVMFFVVVALGLFGMNNTLEFLQRIGLVSLPLPKIEIKEPERADAEDASGGGPEYVYYQRFW